MASIVMLDRAVPAPLAETSAVVKATGATAWGFYLGGAGHFKDHTHYTPDSLAMLRDLGLTLVPIYAGAQSGLSHARGVADAKKAIARHEQMGAHGDLVFADVERSASEGREVQAAQYLSGFAEVLHEAGLRAGLYGAFFLPAAVAQHADEHPDVAWLARYLSLKPRENESREIADSPARMRARYPADPRDIKDVDRRHFGRQGQRGWQFWGDVRIKGVNIDVSVVDAAMLKRPKKKTPVEPTPPAPKPTPGGAHTITVSGGDTLSALEKKHGLKAGTLFRLNQAALDAEARRRGFPDSRNGGLIFAGEVLKTS